MVITVDEALEADLRKVMVGRGLATGEEALRAVVVEAALATEESTRERRRQTIAEAYGAWAGKDPTSEERRRKRGLGRLEGRDVPRDASMIVDGSAWST